MDWVRLNAYTNYVDAHIAAGLLEEHGIACRLMDENTVTIDPILTNAVGGIKLLVERSSFNDAVALLKKIKEENAPERVCPVCGSHNVEIVSTPRKTKNWLIALLTFSFSNFAVAPYIVYHCFDCNHEFEIKNPA